MAQRQVEHIVDSIRVRRQRIGQALGNPELPAGLRDHVQRHPLPWVVGGLALGTVAVSLAVPTLLWTSRRMVRNWARNSFQAVASQVAISAFGRFQQVLRPTEPSAPEPATADMDDQWTDAVTADEDEPL